MKINLIFLFLIFTPWVLAKTKIIRKVTQGKEDQERTCLKAIRNLSCGSPDDERAYITCVDLKAEELPNSCQKFLSDEMDRVNHQD